MAKTHIEVLKQAKLALCSVKVVTDEDEDMCNEAISAIDDLPTSIGQTSDGYHTFDELYEHRFELAMALCRARSVDLQPDAIMAKKHADGSGYDGWFLLMIVDDPGKQISYHLPMKYWDRCTEFARVADMAPEFDGHTSADVLERLRSL